MSTTRSDEAAGLALVTGAAGGIGAAVVRRMAREGYAVAALDVREEELEAVTASLAAEGHRVRGYAADVADARAVDSAFAAAEDEPGSPPTGGGRSSTSTPSASSTSAGPPRGPCPRGGAAAS